MTEAAAAIDWRDPADRIERLVRAAVAFYPAWFVHRGRRVAVTRATFDPRPVDAAPGTVLETRPYPVVATGHGRLIIHAAHTTRPIPWAWPALWAPLRRAECLTR
jgi:methionyl-tRNA formyltransferase